MEENLVYLDQWDFSKEAYGTGGGPLIKSSIKYCPNTFLYVGFTTDKQSELGVKCNLHYYGNEKGMYIACKKKKNILPDSFIFIYGLIKYKNKIINFKNIFTRSYIVIWFLYIFNYKGKIYYYIPGLGNPWEIGKYPIIGKLLNHIYNYIQAKSINKCSKVMAAASLDTITSFEAKFQSYGLNKKIIFLPEGVDTSFFSPQNLTKSRDILKISHTCTVFSYIGRLAKVKGIKLIIDSFNKYLNINSNSLLMIIGNGEEEKKLKDYVSNLQLNEKIIFKGKMNSNDVRRIISSSNACLFGSYNEGFSFSMLEILSCGRPIITTKVSGTKELIIDNITGFVINNRNSDLFSEKMNLITKKDLNTWSFNTRNHIIDNYSDEIQWSKIIKICNLKKY